MALPDLIARLDEEAQRRVEAIRTAAAAQVEAIDSATDAAAREVATSYLDQQRVRRETAYAQALALARRDARTRELDATRAVVRRVLDRARHLVDEIAASPAYATALPAHVDEALSFVAGLQPRVRCPSRLAAIVRPAVERYDGATLIVDDSVGAGVVVEANDGAVTVDNTLAARLARLERDLETDLARQVLNGCR